MQIKRTTPDSRLRSKENSFLNTCLACIRDRSGPAGRMIVFFSVSCALLSVAFGVFVYSYQKIYPHGIVTVSGKAMMSSVPDAFETEYTVSEKAEGREESVAAVADATRKIHNALLALGVQEQHIKTQQYTVHQRYRSVRIEGENTSEWTQVPDGYETMHSVSVTGEDINAVNPDAVMGALATNGATHIGNTRFFVSDDRKHNLKRQAISMAIEDARKNISLIVSRLGVSPCRHLNLFSSFGQQHTSSVLCC